MHYFDMEQRVHALRDQLERDLAHHRLLDEVQLAHTQPSPRRSSAQPAHTPQAASSHAWWRLGRVLNGVVHARG